MFQNFTNGNAYGSQFPRSNEGSILWDARHTIKANQGFILLYAALSRALAMPS